MSENLEFRQGSWWARKTFNGVQRKRKLQTDHKATARKRRDRWIAQMLDQEWSDAKTETYSFEQAAERFAREHFPNLKPSSAKRYDTSLIWLLDQFFGEDLQSIKSAKLLEFEKKRKLDGVSDTSILRDFACLSSIFSCAEEWEWIDNNPVKAFVRGRKKKRALRECEPRTRYLDHSEEKELLRALPAHYMDMAIFAIDTGLRRGEQFRLLKEAINMVAAEITVPGELSKSGKERVIPILPRTLQILQSLMGDNQSPYLFANQYCKPYSISSPTIWEALQKAARHAGVEKLRWHDLRRTCGCRLLQDHKMPMQEVCLWLGHSSIKVTERHYAFLQSQQLHATLRESPALHVP